VLDLLSITSRVPLLKRKIKVQFFGETHEVNCKAMFDSGAVCSFLQQTVLKSETSDLVNRFLNHVEGDANPLRLRDHVVVDHGKDRITIRQQVKFNNDGGNRVQSFEVNSILLNDTVVKPKCEQMVRVHVALSHAGQDVVFTPRSSHTGLYWSNCLCKVDVGGNIVVSAINLSSEAVVAKQGTYVGFASTKFEAIPMSMSVEAKTVGVDGSGPDPLTGKTENKVMEKLNRLKIGSGLTADQKVRFQALLKTKLEAFQ